MKEEIINPIKRMNIDKLKQVIQEADPKKIWEFPHIGKQTEQPIRLADIILALHKNDDNKRAFLENTLTLETSIDIDDLVNGYWDLADNSLDHQSDETKKFLTELLTT